MHVSLQEILRLETTVWEALRRGDAAADSAMLSDNFLGIYPTGFATKEDHCSALRSGPTVAEYKILDPRLIQLGTDLVLLCYLAQWSRIENGQPQRMERMYISSIWQRFETGWKNSFSQDTPVTN